MPGSIASRYADMGGKCAVFGKPEPEHFSACLGVLGIEPSRVAHVGDSLHHDVAGATSAGIDSIFITSGIHKDDLGVGFGELPTDEALQKLFDSTGIAPTHVMPTFSL